MDATKFEALVEQHKDSVYRQMIRVCSNREDAEDALAGALLLAFQAHTKLESDAAFRSWLGTIGRRVCTRMRSHPDVQKVLDYAEVHGLLDESVDPFDMTILKGCVREAVDGLNETYRSVYEMCEIEERTVPEVAKTLGISEAAVKSRLHRARAEIRAHLDQSVCGA